MAQIPNDIPDELRKLVELEETGQLGDLPDEIKSASAPSSGGSVTELFGSEGEGVGEAVVGLLTQILERLDNLPNDIWDEVESR